jgi:hypothetical protein
MESSHIAWHPAFIEAIQLELEEYRDVLEFHPEYQLTSEPLRIDCIVIKKQKDAEIKKNIASIFREVNLLEYKSPAQYVSIADFYKVYAYACLYSSFEKIPITNLTISFVESRRPREILTHLKKVRAYNVEETKPGIYTISGDILPIQIIDNRKLSADENLWLKNLSNRLDPFAIMRISEEAARQSNTAKIQAYIHAISMANFRSVEEVMNMSSAARSLDEVLERTGFNARAEARGEARGKEHKALDIAREMVNSGFPLETIASITKLDPEKIKAMYPA